MTLLRGIQAVVAVVAVLIPGAVCEVTGQPLQIGIVDFYGLNRVPAEQVRAALTFKEGDQISMGGDRPAFLAASEERLAALPGVVRARARMVCCDQGRAIVYVGVEEVGASTMQFRTDPLGAVRLPADVIQAGEDFSKAASLAVQQGQAEEDRSEGHAVNRDPAMRAIQERFLVYARRDLETLRLVLRDSSDAGQRALAAQVLGYTTDKQAVVGDLVQGMADPSEEVRNNAMRTLMVFADLVPSATRSSLRIPPEPFIGLLVSPIWSDRNKASGALLALSANRDPQLLGMLRAQALTSLVEMARWKSTGHAFAPFMILARIAGYSDESMFALWERGDRETVIKAATRERGPSPPQAGPAMAALTVPQRNLPNGCQLRADVPPATPALQAGLEAVLSSRSWSFPFPTNPWIGEDRRLVAELRKRSSGASRIPDALASRAEIVALEQRWAADIVEGYRAVYARRVRVEGATVEPASTIEVSAIRFNDVRLATAAPTATGMSRGVLDRLVIGAIAVQVASDAGSDCFSAVARYLRALK